MKKIFWCLMMLMVLLMPVAAMAEGELPTEPFTWAQLATIAGATLATVLIVQLYLPGNSAAGDAVHGRAYIADRTPDSRECRDCRPGGDGRVRDHIQEDREQITQIRQNRRRNHGRTL